jgi:hypothetical protein
MLSTIKYIFHEVISQPHAKLQLILFCHGQTLGQQFLGQLVYAIGVRGVVSQGDVLREAAAGFRVLVAAFLT